MGLPVPKATAPGAKETALISHHFATALAMFRKFEVVGRQSRRWSSWPTHRVL
jgi:hypothetical protein